MATVTGQILVNNALTIIGINDQGGTPSASDSTDALSELNAMWDGWGIDEGLIYAITPLVASITANTNNISITTAARIEQIAFYTAAGIRVPLRQVGKDEYYSHHDLSATATAPEEYFLNMTAGTATIYVWPAPSANGSLGYEIPVAFTAFTLVGSVSLPPGFQDPIQKVLAARLIPRFAEMIPAQFQQAIEAQAKGAEDRIRAMVAANRMLNLQQAAMPGTPEAETPTR